MRNIKETEPAIKLVDAFVNRMDEAIKVTQKHKQEALRQQQRVIEQQKKESE